LQVGRTDDVVAIEHRPGLVAAHRHRDPFWDPGADVVAHSRPTEVVQQLPGTARGLAGVSPRLMKALDLFAVPEEHPRINLLVRLRQRLTSGLLCLQERAQRRGDVDGPPLAVLRRAGSSVRCPPLNRRCAIRAVAPRIAPASQ